MRKPCNIIYASSISPRSLKELFDRLYIVW